MEVNNELRTSITEQLSGLALSAAEVLLPSDFAQIVISEEMSNEHLVALAFRVGQILEARTNDQTITR